MLAAVCVYTMSASAQSNVGRGARDPLQVDVIVGSEGKGMFTGAGVPPDNMPIFAAKDGAHAEGSRSAADRYLLDKGFLQGPQPLVRSALLPLQLSRRSRADLGRL